MDPAQIVKTWRRGCANVQQVYMDGTPRAPHPEDCQECTAAAMRAVARWVDQQQQQQQQRPEPPEPAALGFPWLPLWWFVAVACFWLWRTYA